MSDGRSYWADKEAEECDKKKRKEGQAIQKRIAMMDPNELLEVVMYARRSLGDVINEASLTKHQFQELESGVGGLIKGLLGKES